MLLARAVAVRPGPGCVLCVVRSALCVVRCALCVVCCALCVVCCALCVVLCAWRQGGVSRNLSSSYKRLSVHQARQTTQADKAGRCQAHTPPETLRLAASRSGTRVGPFEKEGRSTKCESSVQDTPRHLRKQTAGRPVWETEKARDYRSGPITIC
jgi:hypothetical protein